MKMNSAQRHVHLFIVLYGEQYTQNSSSYRDNDSIFLYTIVAIVILFIYEAVIVALLRRAGITSLPVISASVSRSTITSLLPSLTNTTAGRRIRL